MANPRLIKHSAILFGILVASIAAFQLGSQVTQFGSERNPAAIPRIFDYSHLEGEALKRAASDRLIGGAKVITAGSATGIELGHFVTKSSDGRTVSACDVFNQIELTFFATGMAVSGELPEMTIVGPCVPGDDLNVISPLMISVEKILTLPARDQEISDFDDRAITIKFSNVSDSWPRAWVLKSARLISEQSREVRAEEADIRRVLGKAPHFDWH